MLGAASCSLLQMRRSLKGYRIVRLIVGSLDFDLGCFSCGRTVAIAGSRRKIVHCQSAQICNSGALLGYLFSLGFFAGSAPGV